MTHDFEFLRSYAADVTGVEMCFTFSYIAVQEGAPETGSTSSGH